MCIKFMKLLLRDTTVWFLWDGNTLVPLQQPAQGITLSLIPTVGSTSIVLAMHCWRGDCCLACTGCENIKAIERTSGTGLDCQPFILLRKGLYSSCNSSLMTNSLCGAYILSFSFFLWDLHRADSNDFLLDALRIHCVFWMLQRKRRQSRKFETFMGEGFVAFGYKILMSFLLLFSLALYNRRWQA